MAMFLGAMMVLALLLLAALLRCPLARTIGLGFDCFAEASRGEAGKLR